ncbi:hypothetical protein NBRC116583_21870 [Arenicella sp. 4NH20-0111]|uniref:hypothetical protein n=1 Tax=Arenicella sp. 4NH20-0111 TaxID=3127648 RepID=UPI00310AC342
MIIVSTQNTYDWSQAQLYRFAGFSVVFQTPCKILSSFHVEEASVETVVQASMTVQEHLDRSVQSSRPPIGYQGPAPFGDRQRDVTYRRDDEFATIELDDELVCEMNLENSHIHLLRDGGFANMVNVELVTGPAMMIVLAYLKTYCLHASAVRTKAGVVAFVGESGAGKSTLAWQAGDGWQQLSDDIAPILYDPKRAGIQVSTEFPQLKLENAIAPTQIEQAASVDFIVRLNPTPSSSISFKELTRAEAMLQFVRHTVGVKLFDRKIMRRHSKFAQYVATKIPVIELSYPRDLLGLTDLREEIVEYLSKLLAQ